MAEPVATIKDIIENILSATLPVAEWETSERVLQNKYIALSLEDNNVLGIKIGDGEQKWRALDYYTPNSDNTDVTGIEVLETEGVIVGVNLTYADGTTSENTVTFNDDGKLTAFGDIPITWSDIPPEEVTL